MLSIAILQHSNREQRKQSHLSWLSQGHSFHPPHLGALRTLPPRSCGLAYGVTTGRETGAVYCPSGAVYCPSLTELPSAGTPGTLPLSYPVTTGRDTGAVLVPLLPRYHQRGRWGCCCPSLTTLPLAGTLGLLLSLWGCLLFLSYPATTSGDTVVVTVPLLLSYYQWRHRGCYCPSLTVLPPAGTPGLLLSLSYRITTGGDTGAVIVPPREED